METMKDNGGNISAAIGLIVFGLIWAFIAVFCVTQHLPWFVIAGIGFFAVITLGFGVVFLIQGREGDFARNGTTVKGAIERLVDDNKEAASGKYYFRLEGTYTMNNGASYPFVTDRIEDYNRDLFKIGDRISIFVDLRKPKRYKCDIQRLLHEQEELRRLESQLSFTSSGNNGAGAVRPLDSGMTARAPMQQNTDVSMTVSAPMQQNTDSNI